MDADLGSLLQGVLSDPEQMAKLTQAAQGLMGGTPPERKEQPAAAAGFSDGEAKLLNALGRSLGAKGGGTSRSTALLLAMRPYMKQEKQEKLDRALRLTQMMRVVQSVIGELGGGHGI